MMAQVQEDEESFKVFERTMKYFTQKIIDDMHRAEKHERWSRGAAMAYLRVLYMAANAFKQERQVDDAEHDQMTLLREAGFSIGELAFIFDRSKSTLHTHVKNVRGLTITEERDLLREEMEALRPPYL